MKTLEQIEAERMSRRQALGRIGFLAGASAVAALTSDELFRKVGAEMQRRAGDNKIADQVAKEFQAAGIALAVETPCDGCGNCTPSANIVCLVCNGGCNDTGGANKKRPCKKCSSVSSSCGTCCTNYNSGVVNCTSTYPPPSQENLDCMQTVTNGLTSCLKNNNCNSNPGTGCGTCGCG